MIVIHMTISIILSYESLTTLVDGCSTKCIVGYRWLTQPTLRYKSLSYIRPLFVSHVRSLLGGYMSFGGSSSIICRELID